MYFVLFVASGSIKFPKDLFISAQEFWKKKGGGGMRTIFCLFPLSSHFLKFEGIQHL